MSDFESAPLIANDSTRHSPSYSGDHKVEINSKDSTFTNDVIIEPCDSKSYEGRRRLVSNTEDFEPINLSWENINVHVSLSSGWRKKKGPQEKHVLRNVTGFVKSGTLLAIIGSSGAGKSTLINVLTGRNTSQYMSDGDVRVNGTVVGRDITNISAYCQQDEMFIGTLTVRETLVFRAQLRMDRSLSKEARLERVEQVLMEMGLTKCSDTRIGVPGKVKGISGGEMKRLSFASEVLTNPPLMFCDEPTSGLDSFMAQNVVQTLKNMASKGRTILCTIHQPSSEVFAMFDEVLILAEGRTAFLGSTGEAAKFFHSQGYPCPSTFNPADHYILTLAIAPGEEEQCRNKVEAICDAFSKSEAASNILHKIKETSSRKQYESSYVMFQESFGKESDRYSTPWLTQFLALFWRSWVNLFRDELLLRVRVLQTAALGIVLGLVYVDQTYDETGVMNINGAIFLLIMNVSFTSMFSVIHTFPIEVGIFLREYGSGLYRTDVYFLAKTFAELPTFVVLPFLFVAILYWMIGMYQDAVTFLICAAVTTLLANVAVSFGYLLSVASGSVDVALAIGPPLLIPFILFGGLFLNAGSVADYFLWLKYLSWFQYGNEVLSVNQWENVKELDCSDPMSKCYTNGEEVLENLSFSRDNVTLDLWLLVALLVGYRVISYNVLLFKARLSRS